MESLPQQGNPLHFGLEVFDFPNSWPPNDKGFLAPVGPNSVGKRLILSPTPHGSARLPIRLFTPQGLALVMSVFPLGQCEFTLDLSLLQIQLQGDQREAPFHGFSNQASNLILMKQQFPGAQGIMILLVSMRIGADVTVEQPHFIVLHLRVALLKIRPAFPDRFHLCSSQGNPRFIPVEEKIVVGSRTVKRKHLVFERILHQLIVNKICGFTEKNLSGGAPDPSFMPASGRFE